MKIYEPNDIYGYDTIHQLMKLNCDGRESFYIALDCGERYIAAFDIRGITGSKNCTWLANEFMIDDHVLNNRHIITRLSCHNNKLLSFLRALKLNDRIIPDEVLYLVSVYDIGIDCDALTIMPKMDFKKEFTVNDSSYAIDNFLY